jgi:hypothetical protein
VKFIAILVLLAYPAPAAMILAFAAVVDAAHDKDALNDPKELD